MNKYRIRRYQTDINKKVEDRIVETDNIYRQIVNNAVKYSAKIETADNMTMWTLTGKNNIYVLVTLEES